MLFERIKRLFQSDSIPIETKEAFCNAQSTRELLEKLDENLTQNQVELDDIKKEIVHLESLETLETTKIKEGKVSSRQERFALQTIKRIRKQLEDLERRMMIFEKNIDLQLNLIAKIKDMEAMQLKGIEEDKIDEVITEFEDSLDEYLDTVNVGKLSDRALLTDKEKAELDSIKAEILGEKQSQEDDKSPNKIKEEKRQKKAEDLKNKETEVEAE